ncbi:MAG: hypothetical protein SFX73_32205 [Kofleriaceae bacterium]|nr:hypothetical protein [Kofleriaceae bacterium]
MLATKRWQDNRSRSPGAAVTLLPEVGSLSNDISEYWQIVRSGEGFAISSRAG